MATEKRLIDANALYQTMESNLYWGQDSDGAILDTINEAPTVDAVEVVHGRWIDANGIRKSKCENCGVEFGRVMGDDCYYCPTCGAKMDGDGNGQTD